MPDRAVWLRRSAAQKTQTVALAMESDEHVSLQFHLVVAMLTRVPRTGHLGQDVFLALCKDAGLTANPSTDDREGWDVLVECPPPPSTLPADRSPGGLSAYVQIKATFDKRRRTCQVKLSNAMRFAKNPAACFTVLLIFRKGDIRPFQAFVRHFWATDVEQALSAGRAASVNGIPLHKRALTVRFDQSDAVPYDQLLARIEALASEFGPRYPALKQKIVETAGADGLSFKVTTTFDGGVTPQRLLEAFVGEGEPLDVSKFKVVETRFGVPAERDDMRGPGRLTIKPEGRPLELTLMPPGNHDAIVLPALGFYATLPGSDRLLHRFRVKSDFIEITSDFEEDGHFAAKFDTESPCTIRHARQLVKLWAWLSDDDLEYSIDFASGNLVRGTFNIDRVAGGQAWRHLNRILSQIFGLFPVDRWPNSETYKIIDLYNGMAALSEFADTLTQADTVWTAGELHPAISADALYNTPGMLGLAYLDTGDVTLFAVYLAPTKNAAVEDGKVEVVFDRPRILRKHIMRGGARDNWTFMRSQVAEERSRQPTGLLFMDLSDQPEPDESNNSPLDSNYTNYKLR